jgi:hypothetical protein
MWLTCSVCYSGSTYQDNLEPDQLNTALGAIAQNRTQAVVSVYSTAEYFLCNNTIQLTVGTASVGLLCPLNTSWCGSCGAPVRINCHSVHIHEKKLGIREWIFLNFNTAEFNGSFTSLLLDVYVWLNMFRASPRPSSGAYNCTRSLWFYCWREVAGALLVVVCQTTTNNARATSLQR